MKPRLCFGYGSLVNRDTHAFADLIPAELSGWKRTWSHQSQSKRLRASSLSIVPSEGTTIKGLICRVGPSQIDALDKREAGYNLHQLHPETLSAPHSTECVHTYVSASDPDGSNVHPILQSYLDTVLTGFLTEFDKQGVHHFVETTTGWETPILRDRASPIYPRTTALTAETAAFFDEILEANGVNWTD